MLPWQRQVRVVDTRVWGLSQTRIAPLAFMFLFIIITSAHTWNTGYEKQATGLNKRATVSITRAQLPDWLLLQTNDAGLYLLLMRVNTGVLKNRWCRNFAKICCLKLTLEEIMAINRPNKSPTRCWNFKEIWILFWSQNGKELLQSSPLLKGYIMRSMTTVRGNNSVNLKCKRNSVRK